MKSTQRELEAAQIALANYTADLEAEEKKAASRNVLAITEFLNKWVARCLECYSKGLREAFNELETVKDAARKAGECKYGTPEHKVAHEEYNRRHEAYYNKLHGYFEKRTAERGGRKYSTQVKVRDGELEYVSQYMKRTYEDSVKQLEKDLMQEKDRKYDFIINRTLEIVGQITDATGLKVGAKGDLNGVIIGINGRASVKTFGAGGHNIQCFHFRTTIRPAK